MKWTREQYLGLMTWGDFPRPMFCELFGPLIGLDAEWQAQGATPDEIAMVAFDFDYVERCGCGGHTGPLPRAQSVILEETDTHRIERDYLGRTTKLDKRTATIPLPLDFPVKTMDDWLKLKPLFAWREDRVSTEGMAKAAQRQAEGAMVIAGIPGAYDTVRELMGEEEAALAYYDQPELIIDIMDTLRDTAMRVLDAVSQQVHVDQLSVHEDMAGKSGPMIGPAQVQQFVKPYFLPIWEMLHDRGTVIFDMDTDGNVDAIMDDLLDCGLNHLHPMEPAAGMDIVAAREKYGRRYTFNGGIDKFAVMAGPEAIEKELEYKLQPKMREGGIVFGLDHRIPNGTPLEHYRYYVKRAREILGLPPLDGQRQGWGRMAM
jgi:uroporphyrinogen-III decarboxylase